MPLSMCTDDNVSSSSNEEDKGCIFDYNVPKILGIRPQNWTYSMRRDMQEVAPGVFLGPYNAASRSNLQNLLDHGITHIICIRHTAEANFIKPNFPQMFKYLVLEVADTSENIIQHFKSVKRFIDQSLRYHGRVLVHGNAGISKSAALVMAYIMETYDVSHGQAFLLVAHRRFCVNPNENLLMQIKEYEPICKAKKMLTNNPKQNLENQGNKRPIDQTDTMEHQHKIGNMDTMDS